MTNVPLHDLRIGVDVDGQVDGLDHGRVHGVGGVDRLRNVGAVRRLGDDGLRDLVDGPLVARLVLVRVVLQQPQQLDLQPRVRDAIVVVVARVRRADQL